MATNAELIASATDTWVYGYFENNIINNSRLLGWLDSNAAVTEQGGNSIKTPVAFAESATDDDYVSGTTSGTWTQPQQFTTANWAWAEANTPILWDKRELDVVNGPVEKVDLISQRFVYAEDSMKATLERLLLGNGGTNKMNGIQLIVKDTTTDLGGIDVSANSWWKPQVGTALTTTVPTYKDLHSSILTMTFGGLTGSSIGLTRHRLFVEIVALAQANQRFPQDGQDAGLGFETVSVAGVPVTYPDETYANAASLSDKDVYWLNSMYLQFVKHSSSWMTRAEVIRRPSTWVYETAINCLGNLVSSGRRYQGVLSTK